MQTDAERWIQRLGLVRHPEGGFFAGTYRAREIVLSQALPMRYSGPRCASTAIYYLLSGGDFSAFHRLKSDEVWHFYAGSGLDLHVLDDEVGLTILRMGGSLDLGQIPQAVVRAGSWLAACPADPTSFALVGCTVAPGFEFADFELGERAALTDLFPAQRELIERFTREIKRP